MWKWMKKMRAKLPMQCACRGLAIVRKAKLWERDQVEWNADGPKCCQLGSSFISLITVIPARLMVYMRLTGWVSNDCMTSCRNDLEFMRTTVRGFSSFAWYKSYLVSHGGRHLVGGWAILLVGFSFSMIYDVSSSVYLRRTPGGIPRLRGPQWNAGIVYESWGFVSIGYYGNDYVRRSWWDVCGLSFE